MKIIVVDDEPVIADTLGQYFARRGPRRFCSFERQIRHWIDETDAVPPDPIAGHRRDHARHQWRGNSQRDDETRSHCRIILFSGQAASTDLVSKAEAEGYSFEILAKPINPDILLSMINRGRSRIKGSASN